MKFENTQVFGFEGALRGMRNPKNSWNRSDSEFGLINFDYTNTLYNVAAAWVQTEFPDFKLKDEWTKETESAFTKYEKWLYKNGVLEHNHNEGVANIAFIGPNDMRLARTLGSAGTEHRKYLRQIVVSVDITAPLYWY